MNFRDSDFLANELKLAYTSIYESRGSCSAYMGRLVNEMVKLGNIAHSSGLLGLKNASSKLLKQKDLAISIYALDLPVYILQFQAALFSLVVDGADKETIRRYGISRYLNETCKYYIRGVEKLAYIIVMYAVEYIQDGYNSTVLECLLKALIPEDDLTTGD